MSKSKLYTCLMEEQTEDEAFVQVYYSRASHMGEALEKMLTAARLNGLNRPEARELDPCDIEALQSEVEPGPDAETFWAADRFYYEPEPLFQLPYGVIASRSEEGHDIDEIASGFTRSRDDDGRTAIEVNVARGALFEIYTLLLLLQPTYRVFWYRLHEHWDDMEDHFLVHEKLDTPQAILDHLRENELDSVLNGYVTLTSYLNEGATNLNLSDHKRIVILTSCDHVADRYASALHEAGYPQMDELVSIDREMHHWHYRHPDSRSRGDLVAYLHSLGFKDWTPGTGSQ